MTPVPEHPPIPRGFSVREMLDAYDRARTWETVALRTDEAAHSLLHGYDAPDWVVSHIASLITQAVMER